jgi:23S rRNA (uracil1939-C5)-methyltransferase
LGLSNLRTKIKDTAYGGYGVGEMPDGRIVFIPHTVEGDTVEFSVTEEKKNFVYGKLEEVIEESEFRGESYCPYIGKCGGCVFGHIKYGKQLQIKKKFVTDALKQNKIEYPEPTMMSASVNEFRNRATFRIKNKKIGFYEFKSNNFFEIEDCPVIKSTMVEKAKEVAAHTDGEEHFLYITENEAGEAIGSINAKIDSAHGLKGLRGIGKSFGDREISFKTKYGRFYASFGSFLQGNRYLSGQLQKFVADAAFGRKGLELYCGAGFLTLPFAKKVGNVTAIESYVPAIKLAEKLAMKNVRWHARSSEEMVGKVKGGYDVILADPPRDGMEKNVCRYINDSGAEAFIYISCNPSTFARDIKRISKYRIEKLNIVDMFPGSYHVESMALLKLIK